MAYLLYVGLITEGTTDDRFLAPVIETTLIELAYECSGDIDIEVVLIECDKGESFKDYVLNACRAGIETYGLPIMIVHTDADAANIDVVFENKFRDVLNEIENQNEKEFCKIILPLIPIYETESWVLADKKLFKKIIGTDKSNTELNINGHPETYTNPKQRIEEAIRIGRADYPKKIRNQVKISNIYSPIGEALEMNHLESYKSYNIFKDNLIKIFKTLNLLYE